MNPHSFRFSVLRRLLAAFACLALAHCASPMPTARSISSIGEIEGEWDIVAFGGYRPRRLDNDGQRHAFVNVSGASLSFAIECNYSGMAARIDDSGRLIETSDESIQTAMGCGDVRERRDEAFFAFFRTAPTVARLEDGALRLESRDAILLLQRPSIVRRANLPSSLRDIEGHWSADIVYHETDPGSSRNLLAVADGAVRADVEFAGNAIKLAFDCEFVEQNLSLSAPGELRPDASSLRRSTNAGCHAPESDRDLVVSLLSREMSVERIEPDRLHLVSGDVHVVLARTRQ